MILSLSDTLCRVPESFMVITRYKFDDERVTKEDVKRALEEQYGGEEEVWFMWLLVINNFFLFNRLIPFFSFWYSYHRQILVSIILLSNSRNIQMRICLFTYGKVTRIKLCVMWMRRTLQSILGWAFNEMLILLFYLCQI